MVLEVQHHTPGLFLHTGNRLETLAEALAGTLRTPLSSPFAPETILVQSRGMERWVSMALARHNGVFANAVFPFPNAFVDSLCRQVIPGLPPADESRFQPAAMAFRILALLPECIGRSGFEPLRGYLADDADKRKRMQLAEKIADLFDQYLVFRPDLILRWESGKESHWQAKLWRLLADDPKGPHGPDPHRARLHTELVEALGDPDAAVPALPERVSVFGISYLPPFHLEVLKALAGRIGVSLYFVNPCKEYWADIAGRREVRRIFSGYEGRAVDPDADLHLEEGNRLLAATGSLGRDFVYLISDAEARTEERFTEPGKDRLLFRVQSDVLNLRSPKGEGPLSADASIEIHSCHSPMREIEVLYDRLLSMFEEIPGLRPRDVMVMTPDIESAAPLIHAVFDVPAGEELRIPYAVADRSARRENAVAGGVLRLMDLAGSRLPAEEVTSLLEIPAIRGHFALTESEIPLVEQWVARSGIRWGRDARSRSALGLPALRENTWRAGIDRLLLGYAMPTENRLYEGIAPYGPIEGEQARLLGRFLAFVETLFSALDRLAEAHSPGRWPGLIGSLLTAFFERTEEVEAEFADLEEILARLSRAAERSRCREPIGCAVVRGWLERQLENRSFGSGFISGGVTFGAMVPMRSIPFKVVCMIGMNSGVFPREGRRLGFDLMAAHPRPGDRNRRDDDKYLFLEALISARERLYISYVGQNIQDNTPLPPSVLVSELIDAVSEGYGVSGDELVTRHPLQAFSPAYFQEGGGLFSYSEENRQAAESLLGEKSIPPFFDRDIPLSPAEADHWRAPTPDLLCRFFTHPVRFLFRRRLAIHLDTDPAEAESREVFSLDALQAFWMGQDLVDAALKGESPASRLALARAKGALPHGRPGEVDFRQVAGEARGFVEDLKRLDVGKPRPAAPLRLRVGDFQIRGRLEDLCGAGICRVRFARMRSVDLLSGWIRHLILCAVRPAEVRQSTLLVFRNGGMRFNGLEAAEQRLETLLGLFRKGLERPLPLFPRTSEAYARGLHDGADRQQALEKARRTWRTDFGASESDDPHYRCCYRDRDPLDDEFQALAESVWRPLLEQVEPFSW